MTKDSLSDSSSKTRQENIRLSHFPCTHSSYVHSPRMSVPWVLLHGWGVSSQSWQPLLPLLQSYADVILLDVTYFSNNADDVAKDILAVIPERVFMMGWSLGGMLAAHIALHYPERVAGLVTLASNRQFVANEQWSYGLDKETFERFYQQLEMDVVQDSEQTIRQFMGLIAQGDEQQRQQRRFLHIAHQSFQSTPQSLLIGLQLLASLQIPIEALSQVNHHFFGENDVLVPQASAQYLSQHIIQDNVFSRIETIEGAGHLLHYPLERLSASLTALLEQWVNDAIK